MTISVVIPIYNVEKYIRRCLESVIAQDSGFFDIECLIVDDCSHDSSMSIIKDIIDNYTGNNISFHFIHHEENMGISITRNHGILAATGEYLFFIDSDDDILDNSFMTFVSYLEKYPSTDIIIGDMLWVEHNLFMNSPFAKYGAFPIFVEDKRKIMEFVLNRHVDRHACNKFVRRSLVVDNKLFFDPGMIYEDVVWTYRLYSCTSSILIIPELTYRYELNPLSLVHTSEKRSEQLINSFVYISDYLLNNPPIVFGKKTLFTAHKLFVHHWMLNAIYYANLYGTCQKNHEKMTILRRRLFLYSVSHFRLVMMIYFLTMFKPFCYLLKMKWFRANLYRINRLVYLLS